MQMKIIIFFFIIIFNDGHYNDKYKIMHLWL